MTGGGYLAWVGRTRLAAPDISAYDPTQFGLLLDHSPLAPTAELCAVDRAAFPIRLASIGVPSDPHYPCERSMAV